MNCRWWFAFRRPPCAGWRHPAGASPYPPARHQPGVPRLAAGKGAIRKNVARPAPHQHAGKLNRSTSKSTQHVRAGAQVPPGGLAWRSHGTGPVTGLLLAPARPRGG